MHGLHGKRVLRAQPVWIQALPDLTSPRVYQLPKGAGARLAGLNKLFFGDLILGE
jgi:hypothetical protein